MKRNILFFFFLFLSLNFILAQNTVAPSSVNDSLLVKYPEAEKIIWSFEDSTNLYVASFKYFKQDVIAKYTKNGQWDKSITEANIRELPYSIIDYLKDKYTKDASNTIDKILIFEFKNKETYYHAFIKALGVKERIQVFFTLSGKFIKAIEPKEYILKNTPKTKESLENMILNDDF